MLAKLAEACGALPAAGALFQESMNVTISLSPKIPQGFTFLCYMPFEVFSEHTRYVMLITSDAMGPESDEKARKGLVSAFAELMVTWRQGALKG